MTVNIAYNEIGHEYVEYITVSGDTRGTALNKLYAKLYTSKLTSSSYLITTDSFIYRISKLNPDGPLFGVVYGNAVTTYTDTVALHSTSSVWITAQDNNSQVYNNTQVALPANYLLRLYYR